MYLFQGKIWRWAGLPAPSVLSLGVMASEGVFLCLHLPEPVRLTPVGLQSQAVKQCVLWLEVTQAGVPDVHEFLSWRDTETQATVGGVEGERDDGACPPSSLERISQASVCV